MHNADIDKALFFKKLASASSKKISVALAELTGEGAFVEFGNVKYTKIEEKMVVIDAKEKCFGVYSTLSSPLEGVAAVFFPLRSITKLLTIVKQTYHQKGDFSHELKLSAFTEISNIIISTYLSEFSNLLNTRIISTPPKLTHFRTVTLAENIYSKRPIKTSYIFLIGKFHGSSNTVEGQLMLLFDLATFEKLLKTIAKDLTINLKT